MGYRDDPQLWSHLRRFVVARASPCPAEGGPASGARRGAACPACGVAVHIPTARSDGGAPPWLRADGGERKRLRVYQRSDGAILQFDCPLGARRKRAQRIRALGFAAALAVLAAPALGVLPQSAVAPPGVSGSPSRVDEVRALDAVRDPPPERTWRSPPPGGTPSRAKAVPDHLVVGAQIAPGVKRCYERGFEQMPRFVGRLTLVLRVAQGGDVEGATVEGSGPFTRELASCMSGVARRAHFDATSGGGAVRVPFDFDLKSVKAAPSSRVDPPDWSWLGTDP